MKYLGLIIFILSIYPSQQVSIKKKNYISENINQSQLEPQNYGFYKAMLTGNKSKVSRKMIHNLRKYGLLHLLTPSGLHLSSLLIYFKFSAVIQVLILGILLYYLSMFDQYFSMERVIIFSLLSRLIHFFTGKVQQNIEVIFITTILISFLIGHYHKSPLSLIYSSLFWGTIIIYRKNKIKMLLMLNFSLYFSSSLIDQGNSPLSLFINPLFTLIISSCFPVLFLNSILPQTMQFGELINPMINFFLQSLNFVHSVDPFPELKLQTEILLTSLVFLLRQKYHLFIFVLCCSVYNLNPIPNMNQKDLIINLGHPSEVIFYRNNWIHFIDQKCHFNDFKINCKK
ncbi:MAG: hypothetical protein HON90_17015, partial [Halobacteriovoraceae bacterium]|nr:hypothetical protein [Halobacteriovoraceae bacterium]